MLTVTAAILVRGGLVLIARRKPQLANGGRWEFPGGKVRADEDPRRCLRRELEEELGIEVRVTEKLGTSVHADGPRRIRLKFYRVEWLAGEMNLKDHSEVRWVTRQQLLRFDLTPGDRQFAGRLKFSDLKMELPAAGSRMPDKGE